MTVVPITSPDLDAAEVSWFAALCSDDYQFLGVPDGDLRSSWEHCSGILREAERQGFRNILCPSSYQVGQDVLSFVAGNAPLTDKINMLAAVRCGEMQPIMLARTIATLDHMLKGRLTVNIISSTSPARSPKAPTATSVARGGGDSQTGVDAGRDQLQGRGLPVRRADDGPRQTLPDRRSAACISGAIRRRRWSFAASIATFT